MTTRKSSPSLAALNAQIAALQAQADGLRGNERAEIIQKARHAIVFYGLTAADLGFGKANRLGAKTPAAAGTRPASKQRGQAASKSPARKVKFKDAQGNTWGGMGKRPAWFTAALASGKTAEDLLARD